MEKKIRSELMKMSLIMLVLAGLGIYAHEFVIAGIQAKMALNLSIFATFGLAAWLAFSHVLALKNEVVALNALKVDYGVRSRRPLDPYKQPAIVFSEPELLGQGYRMITEELGKQDSLHLSNHTVQVLLHDVDQRINDRKSTIMYFSGLMVFLGLLGAFMGLMKTVHSVGDLIGSMDVSGTAGTDSFGKLIEGMKGPLNGMSVGFSSSLFGLMTSMVLGALERFMTSAMKTLRNEFEHWLSNIAELEGSASDGAATTRTDLTAVTQAMAAGNRQIDEMRRAFEASIRLNDQTHHAIGEMAATVAGLAVEVGRVVDPRPMMEPVCRAVVELAHNQSAIIAKVETLFVIAEQDRAAMRALLDAIHVQAVRERGLEGPTLHAQLDRLIALQSELAERDPVVVTAPPSNMPHGNGIFAGLFAGRSGGRHPDAAARDQVRGLRGDFERLARDVRTTADRTLERIDATQATDHALLAAMARQQSEAESRIAQMTIGAAAAAGRAGPDAEATDVAMAVLSGARAEIERLSRDLDLPVEQSIDAAPRDADEAARRRAAARGQ